MAHDLLTISEFSRLVGVTPSALRYYDDVGLLVPAQVSPVTGYRRYAMDQHRRAVIIRLLRDAGLSLAEIRQVVDQPSHDVGQIIAAHLQRNAEQAMHAATAPGGTVLVRGSEGRTSLSAGGQAVHLGTWVGPCVRAAFAASHLEEALAISLGPDVIIEFAEGSQPAAIRSADHGSLTTLVMPRRSPGTTETDQKGREYGPEQSDRPSLCAGNGGRTGGPAG